MASGPLGSNAQYLFALEEELTRRGMEEEGLSRLAHQVRTLQQACLKRA
ncbi:cation transport regulator ChaC [Pantoea anthophila]|nr:cation transport regulator ChaC [Pantoea anthophila]